MPVNNPVQVNWGSPGAIGSVVPSTGKFTSLLLTSSTFTSTITSALTASRVISFPDKDGTLLTNNDWAKPGAIGSTTPNTGKFSTLIAGASIKNANTLETCSTTEPGTKAIGDLWLEVDGSNYPLYGWWWRWNGTYWLSPDLNWEPTLTDLSNYSFFYCRTGFNYYFRALNTSTFTTVAQTATNYWTVSLSRRSTANAETIVSSKNTIGNTAYAWARTQSSILTHVNSSSTDTNVFAVFALPAGSPGLIYAPTQIVYNYARP